MCTQLWPNQKSLLYSSVYIYIFIYIYRIITFPNVTLIASVYFDYFVLIAISINRYIDHNAKNPPVKSKTNPNAKPQSAMVLGKARTPAPKAVDTNVTILPLMEPIHMHKWVFRYWYVCIHHHKYIYVFIHTYVCIYRYIPGVIGLNVLSNQLLLLES